MRWTLIGIATCVGEDIFRFVICVSVVTSAGEVTCKGVHAHSCAYVYVWWHVFHTHAYIHGLYDSVVFKFVLDYVYVRVPTILPVTFHPMDY